MRLFSNEFSMLRKPENVRPQVSEAEWRARTQCAALYQIAAHYGLTDTIYTHISMRIGEAEQFLINPFGLMYDEITASSLVRVNAKGEIEFDPTGLGINRAGFVIHGAIHEARQDVAVVIHTHTRSGIAVAAQQSGLLPISQHAAVMLPITGYHNFEGIAVYEEEQARLVANLGARAALILRNHGLLTVGHTPGSALYHMLTLERACEAQVSALAGGSRVNMIDDVALRRTAETYAASAGDFDRDWAAFVRLAGRIAPHYAD